ncbi:hypothetical protein KAW38_00595 [Candidatus Micrarchaeota archaeon]|nr:hypothetical protein [Candidatus Micrarchaeota archaeon]
MSRKSSYKKKPKSPKLSVKAKPKTKRKIIAKRVPKKNFTPIKKKGTKVIDREYSEKIKEMEEAIQLKFARLMSRKKRLKKIVPKRQKTEPYNKVLTSQGLKDAKKLANALKSVPSLDRWA